MKQIFGMVNALGLSDIHCGFTRKQLTYGPNPEIINAVGADDYELHLIYSLVNGSPTTDPIEASLKTFTMNVVQWLFDESKGGKVTTNLENTNAELAIAFGTNDITVTCNATRADSSNRIMPEWVEISHYGDIVKLWLHSTALDAQYDHRQYVVAKPIADINDFVTSNKVTLLGFIQPYLDNPYDALNTIIENSPATRVTPYNSLWQNKDNKAETLEVPFTIAVYGPGDIDAIEVRSALKEYLLANSTYDALTWENVFPELFSISTYTLIPVYDNEVDGSIPAYYTPIVSPAIYKAIFMDTALGFEEAAIERDADVIPTVYQSLACAVMPDVGNAPEAATLRHFYNDYILESNLSPDFIRMNATTRAFVNRLLDALPVAEGTQVSIPVGITEEHVNGTKFIAFTVADCHVRILPKDVFKTILASIAAG